MFQLTPRTIDDTLISVTDTATLLYTLVDTASSSANSQSYYGNETSPGDGVANCVSLRAQDGDIRVAIGATPTATKGFLIKVGTRYFFHGEISKMKLIRTGGSSVGVEIAFWQVERGEAVSANTDSVTLTTGDIEIGAVEIKNGTDDTRGTVKAASTLPVASDTALVTTLRDVAQTDTYSFGGVAVTSAAAPVDGLSTGVIPELTKNLNMGFNGTSWDRARSGITTVTATLTGHQNTLPWSVYKTTPTTRTDGQGGCLMSDTFGNTKTTDASLGYGEAADLGLVWTQNRPTVSASVAWSVDKSAALEASTISKATAGNIRSASFRLDSTLASGTYYLLCMNSATLPADGAVTLLHAPTKIVHTGGVDDLINIDYTMNTIYSSAGIVYCISTSEFTKTIGGAYLSGTVLFV
jgi:hypothetical protein